MPALATPACGEARWCAGYCLISRRWSWSACWISCGSASSPGISTAGRSADCCWSVRAGAPRAASMQCTRRGCSVWGMAVTAIASLVGYALLRHAAW